MGVLHVSVLGVTLVAVIAVFIAQYLKPFARWRIRSLQKRSHMHYAGKSYDEALAAAKTARELARASLGKESAAHERSLLHLAAVHAAMRQHKEAEAVLDESETLVSSRGGEDSLGLVPICHARAEVYEALGTAAGMRRATEALERARDVRRARLGDAHLDYAFGCFNLAGLVVRQARDPLCFMDHARRGELAGRAAELAIEAAQVAEAARDPGQGQELVAAVLSSLEADAAGGAVQLKGIRECAGAIGTLREWLATNGGLPEEEGGGEQWCAERAHGDEADDDDDDLELE